MAAQRTAPKRRRTLVLLSALIIIGLPLFWLIRGTELSAPGAPQSSSVNNSQTASQSATEQDVFDKSQQSLTSATSYWVVVNKQRPLNPKTYAPSDLEILAGGQYLRSHAAAALREMLAAASKAGLTITAASSYRSYDNQVFVYNKEVDTNGRAIADTQSARPGHSEHQTGLAVDLAGGGCSIEDCFAGTAEGKWAAANAYAYGFILRYPSGKQAVTGYRYEPWHFRYVGRDLAAEMRTNGAVTLEEFFGLPAAPDYVN